jgi:hypothetical protein
MSDQKKKKNKKRPSEAPPSASGPGLTQPMDSPSDEVDDAVADTQSAEGGDDGAQQAADADHDEGLLTEGLDEVVVEKDKMPNAAIFGSVAAICGLIVALVVGSYELFNMALRDEVQEKQFSKKNPDLEALRVNEAHDLGAYQWVNKAQGKVRIPVDRARLLVLKEWSARPDDVTAAVRPAASGAPAEAPVPPPVDPTLVEKVQPGGVEPAVDPARKVGAEEPPASDTTDKKKDDKKDKKKDKKTP